MHRHKTGALIRASVRMGAIAAGANKEQLNKLDNYAAAIGLAFQVQDDILDVTSDTATLGKQQGADIAHNKPTYVSLLGLEAAQEKAQSLYKDAINSLNGLMIPPTIYDSSRPILLSEFTNHYYNSAFTFPSHSLCKCSWWYG
jgi:geranylgeranyl pyrophosphate synthase